MKLKATGIRDNKTNTAVLYFKELHILIPSKIPQTDVIHEYVIDGFEDEIVKNTIMDLKHMYDMVEREHLKQAPYLGFCILTNKCNMGCTFCYANKNSDTTDEKFDIGYIKKLKTMLPEQSFAKTVFSGGEPLLEFETIKEARPFFVEATIYTNGSLLNDDIAKWCIETNTRLYVSLDYDIEGFEGHDAADVRKTLNILCEIHPKLSDLMEISIVFPCDRLKELGALRTPQQECFEKNIRHEFNFVVGDNNPDMMDFEDELNRVESGEINITESIITRYLKMLDFAIDDYIQTESCSPTLNINYRGDIYLCHTHGSSNNFEYYNKSGMAWNIKDFNMADYYKSVYTNRIRSICPKDCIATWICGNVCWANIEYNQHQCEMTKRGILYAMYVAYNYGNKNLLTAFNNQRIPEVYKSNGL